MHELSLFTGAGGGLLGTHLLGWTPIGYVEINEYCQRAIRARIDDGILPVAPIFTDVRKFIQSGAADEYRGFADVVTAGFPCQPFSVAGKGQAENDERNMWPETLAVLRAVQPRYALLENVPGLLAHEYIKRIFGDLAESGFNARWDCLGADDVGLYHHRKRSWIILEHAMRGRKPLGREIRGNWRKSKQVQEYMVSEALCQPSMVGMANGVANQLDRLKAIGNGQVPAVVRTAWEILTGD